MKFIIFMTLFLVGLAILKYTEPIVRTVGKSVWAETHLGSGGSYNMWKLIAIGVILVGFLYLMGVIDFGNWDNLGIDDSAKSEIKR
jgi:hypothetical protein